MCAFNDLCVRRVFMDHRALESRALSRKVLRVSLASLILKDRLLIFWMEYGPFLTIDASVVNPSWLS